MTKQNINVGEALAILPILQKFQQIGRLKTIAENIKFNDQIKNLQKIAEEFYRQRDAIVKDLKINIKKIESESQEQIDLFNEAIKPLFAQEIEIDFEKISEKQVLNLQEILQKFNSQEISTIFKI